MICTRCKPQSLCQDLDTKSSLPKGNKAPECKEVTASEGRSPITNLRTGCEREVGIHACWWDPGVRMDGLKSWLWMGFFPFSTRGHQLSKILSNGSRASKVENSGNRKMGSGSQRKAWHPPAWPPSCPSPSSQCTLELSTPPLSPTPQTKPAQCKRTLLDLLFTTGPADIPAAQRPGCLPCCCLLARCISLSSRSPAVPSSTVRFFSSASSGCSLPSSRHTASMAHVSAGGKASQLGAVGFRS